MRRWLEGVALVAVVAAAVQLFLGLPRGRSRVATGVPAPAFALPDTEGRMVSLEGLRGRVVAVNFWATWCPACREEIPDLARLYAAHRGSCFELLGIASESGTREEVVAVASKLGVNYPVLLDAAGKVGDEFRIPGYPRTYLVDAGGSIRRVFEGAVEQAELEGALAPLLAETSGQCPRS